MDNPDNFYYHVTYFKNLDAIAEEGIAPDQTPAIGSGYGAHKEGKVFLTVYQGVSFWHSRAEEWAYDTEDDDWFEDGYIPVILRVPASDELNDELEEDELGSQDSNRDAWMLEGSIEPDGIEVFYDGAWMPIEDWNAIDIDTAVQFHEEDGGYHIMLEDDDNPLYVDFR